jgi:hypothetical protein
MLDFEIVQNVANVYAGRLSSYDATNVFLDDSMFSIPEKELHALILTEMVKVNTKPITTERIKNIAELLALYITGPL